VHIVIMGCGRVGSRLARSLEKRGHTVAVIDLDSEAFRRLGPDFAGKTVRGVGFDREVLLEAGIEDAEGFAAVSSGDNSNILSARVVRDTFGVDNVVARIYDPGRAIDQMEEATGARIPFVFRMGSGIVPKRTSIFQDGDLLYAAVVDAKLAAVEAILGSPPRGV
jgi:trk system potassium uptake protein TrkA